MTILKGKVAEHQAQSHGKPDLAQHYRPLGIKALRAAVLMAKSVRPAVKKLA